jgi:hypothetical protein
MRSWTHLYVARVGVLYFQRECEADTALQGTQYDLGNSLLKGGYRQTSLCRLASCRSPLAEHLFWQTPSDQDICGNYLHLLHISSNAKSPQAIQVVVR